MHASPELLEGSIVTLVLGLGLRGASRELRVLASRPRLLTGALVTVHVLVPLLVMSILSILHVPAPALIGVMLLAISPGAPILPRRALPGCASEWVLSFSAFGTLFSIVTVPLWLALTSRLFIDDASLAPLSVARLVTVLFLLPLALGWVLRRLAPELMTRASGPVIVAGNLLLFVVLLSIVGDVVPALRGLGASFALGAAALAVCSILVGHVMAGAERQDRSVLALLAAIRHPGLAVLVARYNFGQELVLPAVVATALISSCIALVYAYWRLRRMVAEAAPAADATLAPAVESAVIPR